MARKAVHWKDKGDPGEKSRGFSPRQGLGGGGREKIKQAEEKTRLPFIPISCSSAAHPQPPLPASFSGGTNSSPELMKV